MRFASWALTLAVVVAPAACSSSDESTTNTTHIAAATVATTAATLPPTTTVPPTTLAPATTTTTTTTAPSTTLPTTTTTSRVVPRPVGLTDEELERYTTNYNQVLDTIEASQATWLAFTQDPFNEELTDAYLSYRVEPLLSTAHELIEEYRSNNYFVKLSGNEAFIVKPTSVSFDDDYTRAYAIACEVDSVLAFQKQPDGSDVLLNDNSVVKNWFYELEKTPDGWKVAIRSRHGDQDASVCS